MGYRTSSGIIMGYRMRLIMGYIFAGGGALLAALGILVADGLAADPPVVSQRAPVMTFELCWWASGRQDDIHGQHCASSLASPDDPAKQTKVIDLQGFSSFHQVRITKTAQVPDVDFELSCFFRHLPDQHEITATVSGGQFCGGTPEKSAFIKRIGLRLTGDGADRYFVGYSCKKSPYGSPGPDQQRADPDCQSVYPGDPIWFITQIELYTYTSPPGPGPAGKTQRK